LITAALLASACRAFADVLDNGVSAGSPRTATETTTTGAKDNKPAAEPEADAIPYETVAEKFVAAVKKAGRDNCLAVVKKYQTEAGKPATKCPELQPKDYEAFLAEIAEIVEAAELT
jgi:hypothetical protein